MKRFFGAILVSMLAAGCVSSGTDVRSGDRWANLQANLTWTRAEEYYADGQYSQALVEYRHFLDLYPDLHNADDASFRIAQSLEGLGERIEAADVYRATGLFYPRSSLAPSSHLRAGEIYELEGYLDEAKWDYGTAAAYRQTEPGKLAAQRLQVLQMRIAQEALMIEEEKQRHRLQKQAERAPTKAAGLTSETSSEDLMEVILGE